MVVVTVVVVYANCPGASGDSGCGEQARPGVEGARRLHAAGVMVRKRRISSTSSTSSCFSDTLDGLCTGHLSSSLKRKHIFKNIILICCYFFISM